MAQPAPVGSDVSAGTYRCSNCGYELRVRSVQSLPPCPNCNGPQDWESISGGDSADDPYPDQLHESGRAVAARVGLNPWAGWGTAWQSAGRTPEPWRGQETRTRCATRGTRRRC